MKKFTFRKINHNIIRGDIVNPLGTSFSVTALANAIALKFSADELELLSSMLNQLAYTLETIAAQKTLSENKK